MTRACQCHGEAWPQLRMVAVQHRRAASRAGGKTTTSRPPTGSCTGWRASFCRGGAAGPCQAIRGPGIETGAHANSIPPQRCRVVPTSIASSARWCSCRSVSMRRMAASRPELARLGRSNPAAMIMSTIMAARGQRLDGFLGDHTLELRWFAHAGRSSSDRNDHEEAGRHKSVLLQGCNCVNHQIATAERHAQGRYAW